MVRVRTTALVLASACLAAACSGDGGSALSLPSVSELAVGALPSSGMPAPDPRLDRLTDPPTEVYTRVARGALTCWFGAAGPLKPRYIYHADAAPASQGGGSQIVIFARDDTAKDPRSQRAFQISIAAVDERTRLETLNVLMEPALAQRMTSDVTRWATGEEGCGEGPITDGWSAQAPQKAKPASKPIQQTSSGK